MKKQIKHCRYLSIGVICLLLGDSTFSRPSAHDGEINTEIESRIQKETNSSNNISAKTVLCVHNGFTSSGIVYEQLDKILDLKPEKQENKNVKIYNSKK
jgi:hypothetical protein